MSTYNPNNLTRERFRQASAVAEHREALVAAYVALSHSGQSDSTPERYSIGSEEWSGLTKALEECGELTQVIGKVMALGGVGVHWDGTNLRERIIEELGDVLGAVQFVAGANRILAEVEHRAHRKRELFYRWHDEAEDARLTALYGPTKESSS